MKFRIVLAALALASAGSAAAEIVVIAHPAVGLASLSTAQVSRLFLGQTDQLPNGAKAIPLSVAGDAEDQFSREILKKSPEQIEKYWARMIFTGKARQPRQVKAGDVRTTVASTPGAISYIDRSQVDASVKVIHVTGD